MVPVELLHISIAWFLCVSHRQSKSRTKEAAQNRIAYSYLVNGYSMCSQTYTLVQNVNGWSCVATSTIEQNERTRQNTQKYGKSRKQHEWNRGQNQRIERTSDSCVVPFRQILREVVTIVGRTRATTKHV